MIMLKNRWFGLVMFFWCLSVSAEIDFLIFPEVGVSLTDETRPDSGKVEIDINPGADFFVTGRWRQFNLLADSDYPLIRNRFACACVQNRRKG